MFNYEYVKLEKVYLKLRNMKIPVGRRLQDWQKSVYNGRCPLCGEECDNEEHAFCECKSRLYNIHEVLYRRIG